MNATKAAAQFTNETRIAHRLDSNQAVVEAAALKPDLFVLAHAAGATEQALQFFNSRHTRRVAAPKRRAAGNAFIEAVHSYMAKYSVDYDRAWKACEHRHVELFNEMARDPLPVSVSAPSVPPSAGALECATLFLPEGTDQQIFNAVFKANGNKMSPVNPGQIAEGLVEHIVTTEKLDQDSALDAVKTRFPKLWAAVQELASGKPL
jgi:hypothetical protein